MSVAGRLRVRQPQMHLDLPLHTCRDEGSETMDAQSEVSSTDQET